MNLDDHGYYKVGTEKFYDKIPAMFRAQQLKVSMEWVFNDQVFSAIDWTEEPSTDIDEFYKIRAKQIREQYDYVVMFCSGGADSTNMFYAFTKNGLHVDEVVGSAPISGLRDWHSPDPANTSPENTIDETFLTQIPWLKKIEKEFPQTKVTLHDYFDDMLSYKADDWILKCNDWLHPSMAGRYNLDRLTHLKRIAESGKKIAVVQGIDKPFVIRARDNFYIVFRDNIYNNKYNSINHPNTEQVFFYHTPELPLMMVKSAHLTARFLMRPENKMIYDAMVLNDNRVKGLDAMPNPLAFNWGTYERGIVPAIYPGIKKYSFQAGKPDKMILGKHDDWFYKHHNKLKVWDMMVSDLDNLIKSLDPQFLDYSPLKGLVGFKTWKKYYRLGHISQFETKFDADNQELIITPDILSGTSSIQV
jgi:hypothetical protein